VFSFANSNFAPPRKTITHFVFRLIAPKIWWTCLPSQDDPFDTDIASNVGKILFDLW
jgi:hypothetical protein